MTKKEEMLDIISTIQSSIAYDHKNVMNTACCSLQGLIQSATILDDSQTEVITVAELDNSLRNEVAMRVLQEEISTKDCNNLREAVKWAFIVADEFVKQSKEVPK